LASGFSGIAGGHPLIADQPTMTVIIAQMGIGGIASTA
jgi:hypothetical protein